MVALLEIDRGSRLRLDCLVFASLSLSRVFVPAIGCVLTSPCRLFGTRKENRAQFVHRSLTCVRAVKIHHYGHHDFNHIVTRYTGCISHRNRSDVGFYHLISVYRWNYYFARGRRVQRQSLDCSNTVERTSATDFSHRDVCIPDAVGELIIYPQRSRISGLRL